MEKRHNALGKGLSALIPVRTKEVITREGYFLCPVSKISVNKNQPRKAFDEHTIDELASSIQANGILQPLVVKPDGDGFQLIAGERRLRAAKKIGLKEVPVIVKDVDEKDQLFLSLIENLQREDINPIDEAEGYKKLMEVYGLSQLDVAKRIGKDRATIANAIRLLKLPDEIKNAIKNNTISPGHARAILSLSNLEDQLKLFHRILDEKLTVRGAEAYVKHKRNKAKSTTLSKELNLQLASIEDELRKKFSTRIKINHHGDKGWIEIHYTSLDEFERILDIIREH
ncbi:MAG: ParB/RepB/Spo0J family partition protein [bacterium]